MRFTELPASALFVNGRDLNVVVYRATTFVARGIGLLFSRPLAASEALWIAPCNAVHTFGMRYGIDVVFLDRAMRVIEHRRALRPGRWAACRGAKSVLELPASRAEQVGIETGVSIALEQP